ncbi:MAG: N-acetylmuramoyl-L-alanine amidase [Deltaproteobacteria bacterium]|nr:N-acetylmuramoyl-L-alanine amidase [Deltaproteobacteria bacterium]MDQ3301585.1 N-acetylmuramoyl-L-alanine amidase [Myxococcota bacterium]
MRRLILILLVLLAPSLAYAQQKIVIDPGHGGNDPGGTGTGMQEKVIVLDVSKRFKTLLDADTADTAGGGRWATAMTRSTDVFVSLTARSQYSNAQNADRFMSIHANAFGDPSANGIETFSLAEGSQGAALRNLVQAEMVAAWKLTNRGNKVANFAVLRETAAPAVLHELAFITNATDAAKLGSATEREKAAVAHLRAIQRHYNIAPYLPGTPMPEPDVGELAGTVINDLGPVEGATVTLDSGQTMATDAEGNFAFTGIAIGTRGVTVTAAGHASRMVDVAIAKGLRANTEIELTRDDTGEPVNPDDTSGGCSTTGGSGAGLALAWLFAAALVARRRRARS